MEVEEKHEVKRQGVVRPMGQNAVGAVVWWSFWDFFWTSIAQETVDYDNA